MNSNAFGTLILAAGMMTGFAGFGASPVHIYDLNGSLDDSLGGLPLVSNGGSLATFGYYTFGANQGPTFLGEASLADSYTIGLRFSFEEIGSWRKIVDFKQRSSDAGLYNFNGALEFYPITSIGTFPQNTFVDVVISRDGVTDVVSAYIEGQPALSFVDSGNLAVADLVSGNALFELLRDDFQVGPHESSAGVLDRVVVYQGALTAEEIPNAVEVPEAGTTAAIGTVGLLAVGQWLRRRKA
jgi:hypothetical protein